MSSELQRLMQEIEEQERAGQLALFGLAAVASHEAIINKMQQGAETLVKLFQSGQDEEAWRLWEEGILE